MKHYATHLCTIWCVSDCAHGEPCVMPDGHEGTEHLAYDTDGREHTWRGWKGRGRCTVTTLNPPEDER